MKFIIKIRCIIKYYLHNKKYFKRDVSNKENIVLLERYNYLPSLIPFSYFSYLLSKKYNAKIYTYNPTVNSFYKQIKYFLNPKNLIINLLYKSFNVDKNIIPKISKNQKIISNLLYKKIYLKIKKKEDILKIKILNVNIGDLIYDEYLRTYLEPTIDPKDTKFQNHLSNMICLFVYWFQYMSENKVKSVIISHSVYAIAIVSRIAIHKGIKTFNLGPSYAYCLSKKYLMKLSGFKNYRTDFKLVSKLINKDLRNFAKNKLLNKLYGKSKSFAVYSGIKDSSFKKIKIQNNLKLKEKILVASHCLTDAVHAYGNFPFPDFYSWLEFLGNLSKKLDYEWIIKVHPNQYDLNLKEIKKFILKYPKFKLLSKEISHNEIINKYKILSVLTVFGSIGHEYPLLGVPVINSSINGPHSGYDFNIHVNSKKELRKLIINIKKIKKPNTKKLKKEIYEFYFMRFFTQYSCIRNYDNILDLMGADYNTSLIYEYFFKSFNIKNHNKILSDYNNFIESNKFRMQADNTKNRSVYLKI